MLENKAMLSRRLLLGSAMTVAATPVLAQPRHATHAAPHGKPADPNAPLASPVETPIGPVDTAARWAYIMDYNTGAVLLTKNGDEEVPPSSMTKLMTIYIVYERLAQGRMKLDDQLPVSEKAWRMGGSKMFVQVGSTVPVEDLIRGVIVDSGNDACIVFAEAISGSEQQFAELMNETAQRLGLTHSHFMNSTGWPDPNHHMSCHDIATLAARIIRDFPQYYHYDAEKTFRYNNIEQGNRNPLVQKGTADGMKTGHTEAGGYGLCASAKRDNRRVIAVLNGMASMRERAEEGERLMDWAFANFEDVRLFSAGEPVENAPVWLGASPTVPLVGGSDLVVTMPRNWRHNAKVQISYDSPIRAPVAKGAKLGVLTVTGQGVPNMNVPLVAGESVPRLGLPGRAMSVLTHYVTGG